MHIQIVGQVGVGKTTLINTIERLRQEGRLLGIPTFGMSEAISWSGTPDAVIVLCGADTKPVMKASSYPPMVYWYNDRSNNCSKQHVDACVNSQSGTGIHMSLHALFRLIESKCIKIGIVGGSPGVGVSSLILQMTRPCIVDNGTVRLLPSGEVVRFRFHRLDQECGAMDAVIGVYDSDQSKSAMMTMVFRSPVVAYWKNKCDVDDDWVDVVDCADCNAHVSALTGRGVNNALDEVLLRVLDHKQPSNPTPPLEDHKHTTQNPPLEEKKEDPLTKTLEPVKCGPIKMKFCLYGGAEDSKLVKDRFGSRIDRHVDGSDVEVTFVHYGEPNVDAFLALYRDDHTEQLQRTGGILAQQKPVSFWDTRTCLSLPQLDKVIQSVLEKHKEVQCEVKATPASVKEPSQLVKPTSIWICLFGCDEDERLFQRSLGSRIVQHVDGTDVEVTFARYGEPGTRGCDPQMDAYLALYHDANTEQLQRTTCFLAQLNKSIVVQFVDTTHCDVGNTLHSVIKSVLDKRKNTLASTPVIKEPTTNPPKPLIHIEVVRCFTIQLLGVEKDVDELLSNILLCPKHLVLERTVDDTHVELTFNRGGIPDQATDGILGVFHDTLSHRLACEEQEKHRTREVPCEYWIVGGDDPQWAYNKALDRFIRQLLQKKQPIPVITLPGEVLVEAKKPIPKHSFQIEVVGQEQDVQTVLTHFSVTDCGIERTVNGERVRLYLVTSRKDLAPDAVAGVCHDPTSQRERDNLMAKAITYPGMQFGHWDIHDDLNQRLDILVQILLDKKLGRGVFAPVNTPPKEPVEEKKAGPKGTDHYFHIQFLGQVQDVQSSLTLLLGNPPTKGRPNHDLERTVNNERIQLTLWDSKEKLFIDAIICVSHDTPSRKECDELLKGVNAAGREVRFWYVQNPTSWGVEDALKRLVEKLVEKQMKQVTPSKIQEPSPVVVSEPKATEAPKEVPVEVLNPRRPISILVVGPTGVGKTTLAKRFPSVVVESGLVIPCVIHDGVIPATPVDAIIGVYRDNNTHGSLDAILHDIGTKLPSQSGNPVVEKWETASYQACDRIPGRVSGLYGQGVDLSFTELVKKVIRARGLVQQPQDPVLATIKKKNADLPVLPTRDKARSQALALAVSSFKKQLFQVMKQGGPIQVTIPSAIKGDFRQYLASFGYVTSTEERSDAPFVTKVWIEF
jgi:hypothetical protein